MMDNKVKFFTCAIVVDWKIFYRYLGLLDFLWGCSLLAVGISLQFQYIRLDQFYQPYRPELGYLSTALIAVGNFTIYIPRKFYIIDSYNFFLFTYSFKKSIFIHKRHPNFNIIHGHNIYTIDSPLFLGH